MSSFFFGTVAAARGLFTLFRKFKRQQEIKETGSSLSTLSSSSSLSTLSLTKIHDVFPSFRGEDVRKDFLSHIQKEFLRKGIAVFIDNNIKRGESIGPEIIRAIRGSKIAIILLSRNYASSSWCLEELVEIMNCKKELGQTVIVIFYKVDPSHVKKLTGDFGKVFRKTCKGKKGENIERWREALAKVATTAGYDSSKWDNEADMIEKVASDITKMLNNSTPSHDFDDLVGMGAHMKKMEQLLRLDVDEVRMIGIWGPSGIGKTTIARFLFNQHSHNFDLSVFMENIKAFMYTRPACSDDYNLKLQLHQQLMCQIFKQKDIEIPHLGVAQDRLKDKRVLVVLDDVDRSVQLDAMAKESRWFGHGSRIVITTQDRRLLQAHGVETIYEVHLPEIGEAIQIFCMNAFGKNIPDAGFEELASEVTYLAGNLPLGLRVMGSYFRGMSKQEWTEALPRLRTHLDSDIQSILKFSYDALDDKDKDLFLHIACFFRYESFDNLEKYLENNFSNVRQGLRVLTEKSLISINHELVMMHNLLVKLGREIVCKQSIHDPGQRQFLFDAKEICEVLTHETGSRSVLGIYLTEIENELNISEKAFNGLSNLQFLRFHGFGLRNTMHLQRGLKYLSRKLRFLQWDCYPMTRLPSEFHTEFLVSLYMQHSKLEKLWEGIRPLRNLMGLGFFGSENLKKLPDLSTATNLKELDLSYCSSLVTLPSTIGNATSLVTLRLDFCNKLVELPSTIGNLHKLQRLGLQGCSKLEFLPTNINLESLEELNLSYCYLLKSFSGISTNIKILKLSGTAIEEVTSSLMPRLDKLYISNLEYFKEFPNTFASIRYLWLSGEETRETPPWIKRFTCLRQLTLDRCRKLVSLHIPDSLESIYAEGCEFLETVDWPSHNSKFSFLNFSNCFKFNKEARDFIIQACVHEYAILPGGEVPLYFIDRAIGDYVPVKLNVRPSFPTFFRFKVCILMAYKGDGEDNYRIDIKLSSRIVDKQNGLCFTFRPRYVNLNSVVKGHLCIFDVEAEVKVTSKKLVFEFKVDSEKWEVGECGVRLQRIQHDVSDFM